jgi:hypothetical protein
MAVGVGTDFEDVQTPDLFAGHKNHRAFAVEPQLRRSVLCGQVLPHGRCVGALQLPYSPRHIQNGDPALSAQGNPQLFTVAGESRFMRFAAYQEACG